ncbi:hypothetical protein ANTPLA_LOCUS4648 [Anthophora plagiata]
MTGQNYSEFLQEGFPIWLENVPLQNRYDMWYKHDGSRSPDLNPLDFFLWGLLKETVCMNASTTVEDMHQRIIIACANITSNVLVRVQHSFRAHLQQCIDVNGHYFEHL